MASSNNNSVATKKDLEELRQELLGTLASKEEIKKLATKEEIKKLATKEELKKLATKEEIKKLATKEEIKKLATKEEIKKLATKKELSLEIGMLATKIDEHEFNRKRTEDALFQAIDGIVKTLDEMRTEQAAYLHTFKRHDARFENHEQRITTLEQQKT